MSISYQSYRRCERKKGFRSAWVAEKVAKEMSLRHRELMVAYQCIDCGCWHVGHESNPELVAEFQEYLRRKDNRARGNTPHPEGNKKTRKAFYYESLNRWEDDGGMLYECEVTA